MAVEKIIKVICVFDVIILEEVRLVIILFLFNICWNIVFVFLVGGVVMVVVVVLFELLDDCVKWLEDVEEVM